MSVEFIIRKTYVALRDSRDWVLAQIYFAFLWFLKLFSADYAINTTENLARKLGMMYPRTKQARANLKLAFPDKPGDEIEEILRQMWGNLGRTAAEYVYLDKIFDFDDKNPGAGRFEISGIENFEKMLRHKGPADRKSVV